MQLKICSIAVKLGLVFASACLVFWYFVSFCTQNSISIDHPQSFVAINLPRQCHPNSITIAPNGNFAIWEDKRRDALVSRDSYSLSGLIIGKLASDYSYSFIGPVGPSGLEPIGWDQSGSNLYLSDNTNTVWKYDITQNRVRIVTPSKPIFRRTIISSTVPIDEFYLTRTLNDDNFWNNKISERAETTWLSFGHNDVSFAYLGAQDLKLRQSKIQGISNVFTVRGYRPDSVTGQLTEPRSQVNHRLQDNKHILLASAEASPMTQGSRDPPSSSARLLYSFDGVHSVKLDINGRSIEFPLCTTSGLSPIQPPMIASQRFYLDATGNYFEILVAKNTDFSSNKVAIFVHGGPFSSHFDKLSDKTAQIALRWGYDVIFAGYPGSADIGPGSGGFLIDSADSTKMAGQHLSAFIQSQGYQEADIIANSFGYGFAVSVLNGTQPFQRSRAVFVAPLVRLREPEEWIYDARAIERQAAFELLAFSNSHNRDKFKSFLKTLNPCETVSVKYWVFGELDTVSKPKDLGQRTLDSLKDGRCGKIYIMGGLNHEQVRPSFKFWELFFSGRL